MKWLLVRNDKIENIFPQAPPKGWHLEGHTVEEGDAQVGWVRQNGQWTDPASIIGANQIDAERDRRIDAGFAYLGKTIQFDASSQANILGACQMAALNILPQPFQWITADNSLLDLTPQQVIEMGAAGAAHKSAHIFAARALKEMSPIPTNYTDDQWWP